MAASELSLKIIGLHTDKRLSDAEIAEELGTSVTNVKMTLAYYRHHPIDPALADVPIPKTEEVEKMEVQEITKNIIALAKEGKSPEEIRKLLSVGSIKVKNSINYGKRHGDIPYTKTRPAAEVPGQKTVPAPVTTPSVSEAPKIAVQAPVSPPGIPDVTILHEMIDLAARLPKVKAEILHSCDEIEATARYQLSLAATIRKALGL